MADVNTWESLQAIVSKIHNKKVREKFRDDVEVEGNTPESRLKRECLIQDNDNVLIALQRQLLFIYYCSDLVDTIADNFYGITKDDIRQSFQVKLLLLFKEKKPYRDNKKDPKRLRSELNINKTPDDIRPNDINNLTVAINREFPDVYTLNCDDNYYYYNDSFNNVKLSCQASSDSEANQFFKKLCDIINQPFNNVHVKSSKPYSRLRSNEQIRVLGEQKPKYRENQKGIVSLSKAILKLGDYGQEFLISRF